MKWGYDVSGGSPVAKKFKINATMATAGVPVVIGTAGDAGLKLAAITSGVDFVGVTLDTGTYSATQGDAEGVVTVIINPSAAWRMHCSGTATAGTQLTLTTNITASAAGTVITKTGATGAGDPDPNSPEMDEGVAVCVGGANVGQTRKITSTGATSATVTVPFLADIAVGDQFIIVPWTPVDLAANNIALTSNLAEAQQDVAVGTGVAVRCIELEIDFSSVQDARNNFYIFGLIDDHILNETT